MTEKRTRKPQKSKKQPAKKQAEKLPEDYSRRFLIDRLLELARQDGITGINATKELRSMLSEEEPDIDLEIHASWVPIVFDDENFVAITDEITDI